MRRQLLTVALTAACCVGLAAAAGLGAVALKVVTLQVGEIASFPSDNFHCQAVTRTQIACGAKLAPNSVEVYYAPHQLEVLRFTSSLSKALVLLNVKR